MMSYSNAGQLVVAAECSKQTGTLVAEPNINMAPPSFNMASVMTPQESVAILWDIENCPVPSDVRPEDVAGNIRMALRVHPVIRGAITMFSAYGDFNAFPRRVREGCQRTGVKLVDVPNGRKDAADKAILVDMFLFALDNRPPSFIMLISGDVDFAHALHILGQRGYSVILVIPSGVGVSSALSNAGRFVWDWPSVARGEGFVSSTRAPRNELAGYSMGCHISDNADGQEEEAIVYKGSSRTQSPLPPGTNDAVAESTASIDQNESTWWVQPRLKVTELAAKFNHLLQYAGPEVFSEEQKIWHFHEWMNSDIKPLMVHHVCSTLEQYVDAAYKLEVTLEESTKKRNRQGSMQNQPQASGFKRPASPSNFVKSGRAKTDMTHGGSTQHSGQSKNLIQCYNCGTHGHKSNECLKEKKMCFGCGKMGHLQSFCPQRRQKGAESQQVSVNQNNQPNFRPVEGPSPSTQTTSQNKGKTSASDRWEQYVDAAYKLEVTLEESTKKHNCQMSIQNQPQTSGFKRPAPLSNFVKSGRAKTDMTHGGSMQHSGHGNNLIQCYNCGTHGHKSNECPKEKKTCFDCGKVGHLHSFCRQKRQKGADSQQESVNQNNRPKFRPLEAPSPSTQTTAQNNEKISAASESQGQHLYEMRDADGPNAPID